MTNKRKQLKQVKNQAQDGRSMVEMLGVLAIIGVLSIGGIAGYRWGMDKHVSNQILYEMNLNSAQLAMLLQRGNPDGVTLSLGSPYDEGKFRTVEYGFDYGCEEEVEGELHKCFNPDETGYFISALNLPERIANMVIESAPNLQYYVDYEETVADEVENKTDVTIFFDINADATESFPDSEVTQPETTTLPETTTDKCENNDDCKRLKGSDDYYCNTSGTSSCSNGKNTKADQGVCQLVGNPVSQKIDTTTYYMGPKMDWWSAERYCDALKTQGKAKNGTLVSLDELTVSDDTNSVLWKKLKEGGWSSSIIFWTSTIYDDNTFCYAYDVHLNGGYIHNNVFNLDLSHTDFAALCK